MKLSLNPSKTTPAANDDEKLAVPSKTTKEAAAASSTDDPAQGNPRAKAKSDAASVLPTPSPKAHPDRKTKKGKGGSKGRLSSPTDKKKQFFFCNYFFTKVDATKGTIVPTAPF